ncbi:unnamed protein product [Mytilus coruscus]|uniref:Uncharacterized protein n=1 Tax=Mytilus coruscus TaxID=42192 RepID=A0A6J8DCN7_MYTCO|nr:unnamed protein product [Mytilus coruscus]
MALYRYLCRNIVGTENHVKTLRLLNTVRDNVVSTKCYATITSGSFGEGLEMRGSDLDVMLEEKSMVVYADDITRLNPDTKYLRMETDDVKPGFTQLLLETNVITTLSEYFEEFNGKHYLSSTLFKHYLLDNQDTHIIHGLCISDKDGLFDYAMSLHYQLSSFNVHIWMDNVEPHTLHTIDVAIALNSKLLFFSNWTTDDAFKIETYEYKRIIHQLVSCDQSSLKYLYAYYISLAFAEYTQNISLNCTRSNKHQYKQYTSCRCGMQQNIHHDAVSGWLMLASFFYKSKQYSNSLRIILYSISKFTPEKLYRFIDLSDIHYQLLKLKSFREKTIVRLWKIMLVDFMTFEKKSQVIPNELQMEVEN